MFGFIAREEQDNRNSKKSRVKSMKLSNEEILYINALHQTSNATVRDCFSLNKTLVFLVNANDMGKVIGKNGKIIRQLSQKMNKKIQIVPYYKDLRKFLEHALKTKIQKIEINGNNVAVKISAMDKRMIMLNRQKFDLVKKIMKRNYEISELKIR